MGDMNDSIKMMKQLRKDGKGLPLQLFMQWLIQRGFKELA